MIHNTVRHGIPVGDIRPLIYILFTMSIRSLLLSSSTSAITSSLRACLLREKNDSGPEGI